MKYLTIIQARTSSTRLPKKSLMPISEIPLVKLCALRADNNFSDLVVATSYEKSDDELAKLLICSNFKIHRGSLDNVLSRFINIIDEYNLDDEDVVIRLTADNPIVDKHFLGLLRTSWENNNLDYLCAEPKDINKSMWPKGLSAEFIKVKNLKESYIKDKSSNNLEHVTPYVKNSNCKKVFGNEITDLNFKKKLFLGIDTFDDYLRLKNIFNDNIMTCYKEIINNLS